MTQRKDAVSKDSGLVIDQYGSWKITSLNKRKNTNSVLRKDYWKKEKEGKFSRCKPGVKQSSLEAFPMNNLCSGTDSSIHIIYTKFKTSIFYLYQIKI